MCCFVVCRSLCARRSWQRQDASVNIQSAIRACVQMRSMANTEQSAIFIQRLVREKLRRKVQERRTLQHSARQIQRWWWRVHAGRQQMRNAIQRVLERRTTVWGLEQMRTRKAQSEGQARAFPADAAKALGWKPLDPPPPPLRVGDEVEPIKATVPNTASASNTQQLEWLSQDESTRNSLAGQNPQDRLLWLPRPTVEDVLIPGDTFELTWSIASNQRAALNKVCTEAGFSVEEGLIEIGYMFMAPGSSNSIGSKHFFANITKSIPFKKSRFQWQVPMGMAPGKYWIAARLLHPRTKATVRDTTPCATNDFVEASAPSHGGFSIAAAEVVALYQVSYIHAFDCYISHTRILGFSVSTALSSASFATGSVEKQGESSRDC